MVAVAKRRIVVTFGLVSGLRVSKVSTVTGLVLVAKRRIVVSGLRVSKLKSVNNHRDRGGPGRETQHCRHFWTRLRVSKVSTVAGIGGVLVAKRKPVVTFGLVPGLRVLKVSTITGIGGVLVAKRSIVVIFGLVFASQKCQQSQGSGGSWSRNADLSSLLDSSRVFAS